MAVSDVKICFVVTGNRPDPRVYKALDEVREFFKDSSINITRHTTTILEEVEPSYWESLGCYFAHGGDMTPITDKIPDGFDIYVVLWESRNRKVCWAGGTWGVLFGIKGGILSSIPWDLPDSFDSVPGQWNHRLSGRIVHEIIHGLYDLKLVYASSDDCKELGFDDPDEGWRSCYEEIVGKKSTDEEDSLVEYSPSWWEKIVLWLTRWWGWR